MRALELTEDSIRHLRDERAMLKARYQRVAAELREDGSLRDDESSVSVLRHYEQTLLEKRIDELDHLLARVRPLKPGGVQHIAHLGSKVMYKLNGLVRKDTLVEPLEADPLKHRISIASPLGSALVGLKPGQTIGFLSPVSFNDIEVLSVV